MAKRQFKTPKAPAKPQAIPRLVTVQLLEEPVSFDKAPLLDVVSAFESFVAECDKLLENPNLSNLRVWTVRDNLYDDVDDIRFLIKGDRMETQQEANLREEAENAAAERARQAALKKELAAALKERLAATEAETRREFEEKGLKTEEPKRF